MINQIRSFAYPSEVKQYYHDRVVSEVFKKASLEDFQKPLQINFVDNHHSNVDYLNYKELHQLLSGYFSSVKFCSDNIIDSVLDSTYFEFLMDNGYIQDEKKYLNSLPETISWHDDKKMFGLYLSRPDVHRFCILIEFYKRGLLECTECMLGFNKSDLMADEHWRDSGIDLACKIMGVSHEYLFNIIERLGKHGRDYKIRGDEVSSVDGVKSTFDIDYNKKSWLNNNFVIEVICQSSATDNTFMLSEKIEKLLILGQPFIIVGAKYTYKNLQNFNIKTYSEFWDESWDELPYTRLKEKIENIAMTCEFIAKTYTPEEIFNKTKLIGEHNNKTHTNTIKTYNTTQHHEMMMNIDYFVTNHD